MMRVQQTFQFPQENQRHLFNQIRSIEDLRTRLRNLVNSPPYELLGINPTVRDKEFIQQGSKNKIVQLTVYFSCCETKENRPVLNFISCNGGKFLLQSQLSKFTHYHSVKQYYLSISSDGESRGGVAHVSSDQNDNSQSEKNQENQDIVKQEQSDSILDSYFPQFPQKSQVLPRRNQQSQRNVNEQNDESMSMQQQPTNPEGLFQFPSEQMIEKIKSMSKKSTIRSAFSNFMKKEGRSRSIEYNTQSTTRQNQKQSKIFQFKFIYHCCKGINGDKPYLLFQGPTDNNYSLKSYNLLHDHRKGSDKKMKKIPPPRIRNKTKIDVAGKKIFKQQQFEFPLKSELNKLQNFPDTYEVKKAFEKLSQLPHHRSKNIVFDFGKSMDTQRIPRFKIKFLCCNGKAAEQYLTYIDQGSFYSLTRNYNLIHVHDVKMVNQMQQEFSSDREIEDSDSSIEVNEQKQISEKKQGKNISNKDLKKQIQLTRKITRVSSTIIQQPILNKVNAQQSLAKKGKRGKYIRKPKTNLVTKKSEQNQEESSSNSDNEEDKQDEKNKQPIKSASRRRRDRKGGKVGWPKGRKRGKKENKRDASKRKQKKRQNEKSRGRANKKTLPISHPAGKQKKITKDPRVRKTKQKTIKKIILSPAISHKKKLPQDKDKTTILNQVKVSVPKAAHNKKQPQVKQLTSEPSQIKQVIVPEQKLSKISEQVHSRSHQRMISQQQQRNHASQMYQQSQQINQNFNHQLKDSRMIFYWLKKYSEKLYRQLQSISPSEINMTQINQSLSREVPDFCELIKNRTYTKKIWNECIEKLLTSQNILMLQIPPQAGQNSDEFQYQDILFVTSQLINMKKSEQQPKNGFSLLLYIGVYPIKLSSTSQNLNLTVAYTLTKSLQAQLVWFCFTKSNQSPPSRFEDLLVKKTNQNPLFRFIQESISHFKLLKVKFIYTSLNYQLIDALENLQEQGSQQTSKSKVDIEMHFQCINALINQNFDEHSKIMQSIYDNIASSPKKASIMKSFLFIKDILNIKKDGSRNNNQNCINPRLIHQNYETFTQMFSYCKQKEFNQVGLKFLSSEYFNEKELVGIKDPVNQAKKVFSSMNGMNILEEAFVLLMVFFDPKRKNLSIIHNGSSFIPMDLYLAQQQCLNFNSISQQQKIQHFSIESIISEPEYELLQISRQCPRIITQTIYRQILLANQIKSKQDNKLNHKNSGQKLHSDKDMDPHMRQNVTRMNQQQQKIGKSGRPVQSADKGEKKWSCECGFYEDNGIPCENQIFAALKEKASLFNEIHSNWKINA